MATDVLTSSWAACQRQMIQGEVSSGSYGTSQSFGPRGHTSALANVVGTLAIAQIVNVKEGRASKLCLRMASTPPDGGESHFAFPSDCPAWSCRDGTFDVRDKVCDAEREEACAQLFAGWGRLEARWVAGDKSHVARWVPGCPIRMFLGGVGGGRRLGVSPEAVLRPTWRVVASNRRNVRGLSFEYVGAHGTSADRSAQRAKPPSAGGQMVVFSPSSGK